MHSMYVPHVVCFLKTIIRTCGYRLIVVSLTIMCTSIFSFVSFSLDYSVKWYRSHVLIYFCPSLLFNCLSYTISCPPLPANLILGLALTIVSTSLIIWHTTPSLMYNHHTSFAHLLSSLWFCVPVYPLIQVTFTFNGLCLVCIWFMVSESFLSCVYISTFVLISLSLCVWYNLWIFFGCVKYLFWMITPFLKDRLVGGLIDDWDK